jgi:hypothetical protein
MKNIDLIQRRWTHFFHLEHADSFLHALEYVVNIFKRHQRNRI